MFVCCSTPSSSKSKVPWYSCCQAGRSGLCAISRANCLVSRLASLFFSASLKEISIHRSQCVLHRSVLAYHHVNATTKESEPILSKNTFVLVTWGRLGGNGTNLGTSNNIRSSEAAVPNRRTIVPSPWSNFGHLATICPPCPRLSHAHIQRFNAVLSKCLSR